MSENLFKQDTSKFLHGVRGLVQIDGNIEGAVQNVNVTESGEADLVRVMGSRYIQGKELKDKIVEGTIEVLMFDPESQFLMQLTEPVASADDGTLPTADDLNTALPYDSTRVLQDLDPQTDFSLMPVFDIECRAKVLNSSEDGFGYYGFTIKRAMITSYELRMNMNTFWLANVSFVADKVDRSNIIQE